MGGLSRSSPISCFPDGKTGQRGKETCPGAPQQVPRGHWKWQLTGLPAAPYFFIILVTSPRHPPHHWAAPVFYFLSPSCSEPCPGLPVASPLPWFTLPLLPRLSSPGPWSQGSLSTLSLASAFFPLLGPLSLSWGCSWVGLAPFLPPPLSIVVERKDELLGREHELSQALGLGGQEAASK